MHLPGSVSRGGVLCCNFNFSKRMLPAVQWHIGTAGCNGALYGVGPNVTALVTMTYNQPALIINYSNGLQSAISVLLESVWKYHMYCMFIDDLVSRIFYMPQISSYFC